MTLYQVTIPANTANAGLVNCENDPASTMKAVGGGAVPTDLNTTNSMTASYAVFGTNLTLPLNASTNANGWRVLFQAVPSRPWTVFVLCAT